MTHKLSKENIASGEHLLQTKDSISQEQMMNDYNYFMAQKILKSMLENNLVTVDEFNKISEKNRHSFSPYLAGILA